MYYQPLGLSLKEIQDAEQSLQSQFSAKPFQWKSEYLPLIIGFAGVVIIGMVVKYRKKKAGLKKQGAKK